MLYKTELFIYIYMAISMAFDRSKRKALCSHDRINQWIENFTRHLCACCSFYTIDSLNLFQIGEQRCQCHTKIYGFQTQNCIWNVKRCDVEWCDAKLSHKKDDRNGCSHSIFDTDVRGIAIFGVDIQNIICLASFVCLTDICVSYT